MPLSSRVQFLRNLLLLPGMSAAENTGVQAIVRPTFAEAFRFWLKLGFISFGGPGGQIAIMHAELVERKKWIGESHFLHALNYCMLLPGPEATQLAIYAGWLLHKTWGGIVAGALFVLPSAFILWALSYVYAAYGDVAWIAAIFCGLKPAVIAIVASAVIRIGRQALKNEVMCAIAGLAFASLFFFHVPFPAVVMAAGIIGLIGGNLWRDKFLVIGADALTGNDAGLAGNRHAGTGARDKTSPWRGLRVAAVCIVAWWMPTLLAGLLLGWQHTVTQEGIFFSKAAVVTFGGAYAVLPYVSQQAVTHFGWLGAPQMLDGLGLAETTPGPLIMVLQFVGFLGGWNHPGGLPRLLAATLGAAITTWSTFAPCFLWIFLGAPHIERLRGNVKLTAALSAITAAVVGVILNLAVWFALNSWFPKPGSVDWFAIAVSLLAFTVIVKWKWGIIPVIASAAALGLFYKLIF